MRQEGAFELLPGLQQGRLSPDERRQVEGHVAGCDACARELERLGLLAEAVGTVDPSEPRPSPDLLARALARLPAERARRSSSSAWLAAGRDAWTSFWSPLPTPARVALVVQFALLLAVGAAWIGAPQPDGEILTLGEPPAGAASGGASLIVAFDETASLGQVRQTLVEIGGTIIGGPSAAGFYTVEVPLPPGREPEIEALLARLRRSAVVHFAERAP